jgi:hypothetical protein
MLSERKGRLGWEEYGLYEECREKGEERMDADMTMKT